MKFRDLKASEIECRVQSVKQNGLVLLLYKDARVDMNILDESVGSENWQREHYECKGNLYCNVGIRCKPSQSETMDYYEWVWKSDCGTESNTEAQKGEASDSFKRACFNWGIGRELYTAPFVWIGSDKCNIKNNSNRFACYDKFRVSDIDIKAKTIVGLEIVNDSTGQVVFTYGEIKHSCADCGKTFEPFTDRNGKSWSGGQVYHLAIDAAKKKGITDGKARCSECMNKLLAKEK